VRWRAKGNVPNERQELKTKNAGQQNKTFSFSLPGLIVNFTSWSVTRFIILSYVRFCSVIVLLHCLFSIGDN